MPGQTTVSGLPSFIIGAAPKCATTSIANALRLHPDVFIPDRKELVFFNSADYQRGLDWYANYFTAALPGAAIGEATPSYFSDKISVSRLSESLPDAKLIAVLRNPVERAQSHYWARRRFDKEPRSLLEVVRHEQALDDPWSRESYLLRHSRYGMIFENLVAHFPRDQILLLFVDDLRQRPAAELARLQEFIGVTPEIDELPEDNVASTVRSGGLQRLMNFIETNQSFAKRIGRRLVSKELRRRIRWKLYDLNKVPTKKASLQADELALLRESLRPDLEQFAAMVDAVPVSWSS